MSNLSKTESLKLWDRYGDYVLMATAYMDEVFSDGDGCTLRDVDGNEYLDFVSGQICANLGHNHPEFMRRLTEQLGRIIHTGTSFLSPVVFEAGAKFAEIAPGDLQKTVFLSTGAEANEYALRLAKEYTGRTGTLCLCKGYAGLTLQTSSLTNYGKSARPIVPGTGYLATPDPTKCPEGVTVDEWAGDLLEVSLEVNRGLLDNVAAIIFEPILSAGGLIVLPDDYMRRLRRLADDLGAVLIADEAQSGMGRTGKWYCVEHAGVTPDFMISSKGVGGGMPLSAVTTTSTIAGEVLGRANQYSSHQSDALAAAAGIAVIEIIEAEGLLQNARNMGDLMMGQLDELSKRHPQIRNVRGRGLMIGFDVFRDPERDEPDSSASAAVQDYCRTKGIITQFIQRNRFRVLPPLTVGKPEIDRYVSVLDEALSSLAQGSIQPRPPQNPHTAAFAAKHASGLKGVARWAWNSSPKQWMATIRKKVKGRA